MSDKKLESNDKWVDDLEDSIMRFIMSVRDNTYEPLTHSIAKMASVDLRASMENILRLGGNINGRDPIDGFTPLQVCILNGNYRLAEWLCERPDIDLDATNHAGKTAYQLAFERNDSLFMKMLRDAGCKGTSLCMRKRGRITKIKRSSSKPTLVRRKK